MTICNDCMHCVVCKFKEEMDDVEKSARTLENKTSNVKIVVDCKYREYSIARPSNVIMQRSMNSSDIVVAEVVSTVDEETSTQNTSYIPPRSSSMKSVIMNRGVVGNG